MSAQEHYQKGMEYFVADKLDSAIDELRSALDLEPDHADALHALAMSYYHQKDLERAVRFGERLLAVAPDNNMAYTCLSMLYQAQGRIKDAEDMLAAAAKLPPPDDDDLGL